MKKILLFLLFFSVCEVATSQKEILTNQSISEMIELGFSEDIVITKIKTSETDFDTSVDALKTLKEKGVSDAIIVAAMNSFAEPRSSDVNMEVVRTGIYFNKGNDLSKIFPSVFTGTKTNTLGSSFTYGLASSDIKSVIVNAESNNVIKTDSPEFWFYFAPGNEIDLGNWWFFSATSPNEFVLVRLDKKKKAREMKTGSVNIYAGTNKGIAERHVIPFNIELVNDHVFKVTPKEPFEDGEYCFFYQGSIPQGGYNNQSVFDFSIQAGKKTNKKYSKRWGKEYMDDAYE